MRRAASLSAGVAEAGVTGSRLRLTPRRGRASRARIARAAWPWASSRWWTARAAVAGSWIPGACTPAAWPRKAAHHGSFRGGQVPPRAARGPPGARARVLGAPLDPLAAGPAAGVLEGLGEVPVIEGDPRLHPTLQQA